MEWYNRMLECDTDEFLAELGKLNEALASMAGVSASVTQMIRDDQFHQLQAFFQEEGNQHLVDRYIDIPSFAMTSLEYAVHDGNWRMASFILLSLGADPHENCFDGLVQTMASSMGYDAPEEIPGFDEKAIPGFQGLKAIANGFLEDEDLDKMLAFLSLMEWVLASQPGNSPKEGIVAAIANIRRLDPPGCTSVISNLKETVWSTQLVLRQHANELDESDANDTLCHVVQNFVWTLFACEIKEHCMQNQDGLEHE